jgi:hypothetical protein
VQQQAEKSGNDDLVGNALFQYSYSGSELTLINAELEKARRNLYGIRNEAKQKINIEVKDTRQKLNEIISKENKNPKEKKLEIQRLKEKLKADVKMIREDAKEQAKNVIEEQNSVINKILS